MGSVNQVLDCIALAAQHCGLLLICAPMNTYSSATAPAFRAPRRVTITLPHSTYHGLLERSDAEGRSMSNLAAYLLESSLDKE